MSIFRNSSVELSLGLFDIGLITPSQESNRNMLYTLSKGFAMPPTNESREFENLIKRLDVLLNVILSLPAADGKQLSLLKRVELLSSSGVEKANQPQPLLRNIEIARILGISPDHVGVLMNTLRKKAKQPKKFKRR
jgi:hypothetical protein